jgi:hypothetical protein
MEENNVNNGNTNQGQEVVQTENQIKENQQKVQATQPAQPEKTEGKFQFSEEIRKMISTAGTLELSEKQNEILFAPVQDDEVYIKPDGLIYMTWTKYSSRLSRALGASWTMLPENMPKISKDGFFVIWGFHLIIKGVYCGFAIGEQEIASKRMTFGEACEGAKSNALTRLCKSLGIGLELWDKGFIDGWLSKYADKKWVDGQNGARGKNVWSLKQNAFANFKKPQAQPIVQSQANDLAATNQKNNSETKPDSNQKTQAEGRVERSGETTPLVSIINPEQEVKIEVPKANAMAKQPIKEQTTTNVVITKTNKSGVKETPEAPKTEDPKTNNAKKASTLPPPSVTPTPKTGGGGKGNGKNSKLPENNSFLSKVPLVPMSEEEAGGAAPAIVSPIVAQCTKTLEDCVTTAQLKPAYDKIRQMFLDGQMKESEKEELRGIANQRFRDLAGK